MVALLSAALAFPIAAANTSVTGSLSYRETIALTPKAVAIVTIVDQTAAADAGAVVGPQRIDAPTTPGSGPPSGADATDADATDNDTAAEAAADTDAAAGPGPTVDPATRPDAATLPDATAAEPAPPVDPHGPPPDATRLS